MGLAIEEILEMPDSNPMKQRMLAVWDSLGRTGVKRVEADPAKFTQLVNKIWKAFGGKEVGSLKKSKTKTGAKLLALIKDTGLTLKDGFTSAMSIRRQGKASKYEKSDFMNALELAVESNNKYSIVARLNENEEIPFEQQGEVPAGEEDVENTELDLDVAQAINSTDGLEFSDEFLQALEAEGIFDEL